MINTSGRRDWNTDALSDGCLFDGLLYGRPGLMTAVCGQLWKVGKAGKGPSHTTIPVGPKVLNNKSY
jgi:hypothetical protein